MGSKQSEFTMPNRLVLDEETATLKYGKFLATPFEKGFGDTLGNSLRRVLLSSLEGTAATWIRIEDVPHEYAPVPDVVEDITDIILNFKKVKFKTEGEVPRVLELFKDKKGPVTAADIKCDGVTEVVNPDQYICTLDKNTPLRIEINITSGKGWSPADNNKPEDAPIGIIPIDALFSPVERVSYSVTDTRVGQMTDYDQLNIEVWTDGRISPEEAVRKSASILRSHLIPFCEDQEEDDTNVLINTPEDEAMLHKMMKSVDSIELSVRAQNCLKNAEIQFIGELVQKSESEMLRYRNFGRKSLDEIKERMGDLGLSINMKIKDEIRVAFAKELEKEGRKADAP